LPSVAKVYWTKYAMKLPKSALSVSFFATLIVSLVLPQASTKGQGTLPFKDPALPIEKRVDDLVGRMTLEEKVSQMINAASAIERLDVPAYDWWNETLHGVARAGYATVFPRPSVLPRLGMKTCSVPSEMSLQLRREPSTTNSPVREIEAATRD
jgi:hypothetical protein